MPQTSLTTPFHNYVPKAAESYCVELWQQYGFRLKLANHRQSKWGDYRYRKLASGQEQYQISVNRTLPAEAFLLTYLHEVAHLIAFQKHGFRIRPHGAEWKSCFRKLLQPVLTQPMVSEEVLLPLQHYACNPKATVHADAHLLQALLREKSLDSNVTLASVAEREEFVFQGRKFLKEKVRRTRALCREVASGKRYTIALSAYVEEANSTIAAS
ncbi:SprT-like domain-containing protein [Tunicatimonas pelagia]|uniref:SprT-like domain-containing protein n=1 Tax=Tunicatimonas pelagia TaxID=931531 RepID=UPI0026654FED|nr:SprT-like domain-containing protein [Tunicatimonas pelagia]WKN41031.1 SprT-like domain-containing protein [Tunicatimonas pelagia]